MTVYSIFIYIGIAAVVLTAIRYFIKKPSNLLVNYLQNFVGALFIFSGFVKAVDPLGLSYKMHEYFGAFSQEGLPKLWDALGHYTDWMSILIVSMEMFFGLMLIIGWKPRFTVAIVWMLTLFFTFLTGYTYLSGYAINPPFILMGAAVCFIFAMISVVKDPKRRRVITALSFVFLAVAVQQFFSRFGGNFVETKMKVTDCGCFGDFMKLKPWETFWKDVFLDVLILVLVLLVNKIDSLFTSTVRMATAATTAFASLALCIYCTYFNEPLIDFRPYAVGSNIVEARKEVKPPVVEMLFNYKNKKTGEVKGYNMKELTGLNYDELEFVDRKDNILDPGIPAKISNLRIENDEGGDVTDSLLSNENYSLMVVSYNLAKSHDCCYKKHLNAIADACAKAGIHFYMVTVNDGKLEEFKAKHDIKYNIFHADETPLKTIIRSNPGLVLWKNGVVMGKWHHGHFPTFDELNANYFSKK